MEDIGLKPVLNPPLSTLLAPTDYAMSDEPATWLAESNRPMADSKSFGRFQRLHIRRGEILVEWQWYLGPSDSFTAPEFQILGGNMHIHPQDCETVGSLRDQAEMKRMVMQEAYGMDLAQEPTITQELFLDTVEEKKQLLAHRSVSGPRVKIERR